MFIVRQKIPMHYSYFLFLKEPWVRLVDVRFLVEMWKLLLATSSRRVKRLVLHEVSRRSFLIFSRLRTPELFGFAYRGRQEELVLPGVETSTFGAPVIQT